MAYYYYFIGRYNNNNNSFFIVIKILLDDHRTVIPHNSCCEYTSHYFFKQTKINERQAISSEKQVDISQQLAKISEEQGEINKKQFAILENKEWKLTYEQLEVKIGSKIFDQGEDSPLTNTSFKVNNNGNVPLSLPKDSTFYLKIDDIDEKHNFKLLQAFRLPKQISIDPLQHSIFMFNTPIFIIKDRKNSWPITFDTTRHYIDFFYFPENPSYIHNWNDLKREAKRYNPSDHYILNMFIQFRKDTKEPPYNWSILMNDFLTARGKQDIIFEINNHRINHISFARTQWSGKDRYPKNILPELPVTLRYNLSPTPDFPD